MGTSFARRAQTSLERFRIQAHLRRVERVIRRRCASEASSEVIEARRRSLASLHEYWVRGEFPKNTYVRGSRVPVFRDARGTTCAVAYLLDCSGASALVESIASTDNHVRVRNVKDGPLLSWLRRSGITQEEAAAIQPSYDPALDVSILVILLYAVLVPLQVFASAIALRLFRGSRLAAWARNGLRIAAIVGALWIGLAFVVAYSPTYGDPYAPVFRTALLVAFLITLIPLEILGFGAVALLRPETVRRRLVLEAGWSVLSVTLAAVVAPQIAFALAPQISFTLS